MRLYAQVYQRLGIDYGIVNSIDGYDEISLTGDFKVATNNYERVFSPADLGFVPATPEELVGGANEDEAAEIFGKPRVLDAYGQLFLQGYPSFYIEFGMVNILFRGARLLKRTKSNRYG